MQDYVKLARYSYVTEFIANRPGQRRDQRFKSANVLVQLVGRG